MKNISRDPSSLENYQLTFDDLVGDNITFFNKDLDTTIVHATWIIENYHMEFDWLLGKAHLIRGKCYDILGKREDAKSNYKVIINLDNYFPDGDIARELLKHPYSFNNQ